MSPLSAVVSPEVLFLEMAALLLGIELVKLGYELSGYIQLPMSHPTKQDAVQV